MQVIVPVSSSASVSELVLPIGHWVCGRPVDAAHRGAGPPANRRQVHLPVHRRGSRAACADPGRAVRAQAQRSCGVQRHRLPAVCTCLLRDGDRPVNGVVIPLGRADANEPARVGHARGAARCRVGRAAHRRRPLHRADGGCGPGHRSHDCRRAPPGSRRLAGSRGREDSKDCHRRTRLPRRGVPRRAGRCACSM